MGDAPATDQYIRVPPLFGHVTRDRSLEDFLGGTASEGSDAEEEPEGAADGPERGDGSGPSAGPGTDPAPAGDGAAPIAPTYRWSPDGEACRVCAEQVNARWRADDALVCADCKEW